MPTPIPMLISYHSSSSPPVYILQMMAIFILNLCGPIDYRVPDKQRGNRCKRLFQSFKHILIEKRRFGKSRHQHKQAARKAYLAEHGNLIGYNPGHYLGIHSYGTMKTYISALYRFARFCTVIGVKHTDQITETISAVYLWTMQLEGKSAWTIRTAASAINKTFGFNLSCKALGLPPRRKQDIRRSRGPKHYSPRLLGDNHDQMTMTLASGIRRMSMLNICPNHFIRNKDDIVIGLLVQEKGGLCRIAPILNCYKDEITAIVDRAIKANGMYAPIFDHYSLRIDNHALRAQYCGDLLHQLEDERAKGLPLFGGDFRLRRFCHLRGKDRYRGPKTAGHDTDLLGAVSGAMGHNRVSVVPQHYLWLY